MSRKKLKSLAPRVLLLVTSFLVILLILEVVVRIFMPQQLIVRRPHMYRRVSDGFGWKHQVNVSTVVNTGEGEVHFYTNEKGFRVGSANEPLRDPDYKVLALGDSFLEALQVEYEHTLTAIIERELTAQMGVDVEVVDTGVSDWDPNQYLMQAKEELASSDYDLVLVFLYTPNDIIEEYVEAYPPRDENEHQLGLPTSFSKSAFVDSLFFPINDFLEEHSQLYIFTRNGAQVILAKMGLSRYYIPDSLKVEYADSPAWAVTADVCARIADEAERYGVPIVFVHLPGHYAVESETLDWYIDAFNVEPGEIDIDQAFRILNQELETRGMTLLDAAVPLRAAYEADEGRVYGQIDAHFTALGHRVVGEFVVDWLADNTLAARPD